MNESTRISLIRLGLAQVIPIVGLLFFEWRLFDLAVLYILESVAVFFVFNFYQYFIRKETRYPIPFAIIQLLFALIFFSGVSYAYLVITYLITGESAHGHFADHMHERLLEMHFWSILLVILIFEFIGFFQKLRISKSTAHLNFIRVMKRQLFSYLFIIGGLFLFTITAGNHYIMYAAFMLVKLAFEISMEDQKVKNELRRIFFFSKTKS